MERMSENVSQKATGGDMVANELRIRSTFRGRKEMLLVDIWAEAFKQ